MDRIQCVRKTIIAGSAALAVAVGLAGRIEAQVADPVAFGKVTRFDIGAQPLSKALLQFSSQANIVVVAPPDLVQGKQSRIVQGTMPSEQALIRLLGGSGLSYVMSPTGGVMIVRAADGQRASQDVAQPAPPAGAPAANAAPFGLEEIIVTAQKRSENIQNVPVSVTVIDSSRLENINAQQLTDYAGYIPGFTVQSAGIPGSARLTLRGIASSSSATVGTYIDEVPLGSSTSFGDRGSLSLDLVPYDIAGVEVFRGPQGTLYGANAMGGILKYTTRAPQLDRLEARIGGDASMVKGGSETGWSGRASISAPLIDDRLAVRTSVAYQKTPGFVDNALTGAKDENGGTIKGGRLALLWAPSEDVTVQLATLRQDTENGIGTGIAVDETTGKPVYGDLRSWHTQDLPSGYEQTLQLHTATIAWDVGWAQLTAASGFSNTDTVTISDASAQFFPLLGALVGIDTFNELEKFTQEIRLASPAGERIEWLAGAFYTSEDYQFRQTGTALTPAGAPAPGLNPLLDATLPSTYREFAVYGDVTYKFSDAFDLTAGLRWTDNRQTFHQTNIGFLFNPADPSSSLTDGAEASDEIVNYMVSPRFHIGQDVMIYGRVASGYRPGGPNVAFPGAEPTYDADTLVNYEAGIKSEFLDDRALLNLAIFYIDWQDVQVVGQTPTLIPFIANAGDAKSQGAELSATFSVPGGLRLGFNGAFTDATVSNDMPALRARAGERLPNVARWSGSLTADYELQLGGSLSSLISAGYQYTGERDARFRGDPRNVRLDAYGIVDLSASLSNERWTARLFVRNLADERAYISPTRIGPATFESFVNRPRTIGVSLDVAF